MANALSGLLGPPARTCLRGHGAMAVADGTFALTGVNAELPTGGSAAFQIFAPKTLRPNGQVYALKVWRCSVCGSVELVDEV